MTSGWTPTVDSRPMSVEGSEPQTSWHATPVGVSVQHSSPEGSAT